MSGKRNFRFRKMKKSRTPTSGGTAPAAPEGARTPTYDDILAIVRLIESGSRFSEFRLRLGDIEVDIKCANGANVAPAAATPQSAGDPAASQIGPRATAATAAPGATTQATSDLPAGTHVVKSPMVGTFYRAPDPAAAPFVEVGAKVQPDTTVCIIEVMKLMNSVAAGVEGVVTHVFVGNAQPVEFGQPLIAIGPK